MEASAVNGYNKVKVICDLYRRADSVATVGSYEVENLSPPHSKIRVLIEDLQQCNRQQGALRRWS